MISFVALIPAASAAPWPTVDVEICVQYDVDYVDADDPGGAYNYAAGDYWTDNAVHRPAMHQFIEVENKAGSQLIVQDV
jgi:hypothetical protein